MKAREELSKFAFFNNASETHKKLYIAIWDNGFLFGQRDTAVPSASEISSKGLAAVNMEAGTASLFEAVKVICEDYNEKILKPKQP
jgi:hypothetical protein